MYACGDSASRLADYAWFDENTSDVAEQYAHRVGMKRPNAWGLYDMHGNVWEWCLDWYGEDYYSGSPLTDPVGPATGSARVARGGGWYHTSQSARSANRRNLSPGHSRSNLGLRVARSSVRM
jgi:sulfatase modifying factor 1